MPMRSLFATRLYEADLDDEVMSAELAHSIRCLAKDDEAGRRWSREHHYSGYTSYASLNDLPKRDPAFADLAKVLTRHAVTFAGECAFDMQRKPRLDSLWVNLLKGGGHHAGHIHPHSIISGTLYVEVPEGSGAIRFEDPRLPSMMAAPRDEGCAGGAPAVRDRRPPARVCSSCGKAGCATRCSRAAAAASASASPSISLRPATEPEQPGERCDVDDDLEP